MSVVWRALALTLLLVPGTVSIADASAHSPTITFFFGLKRPEAAAQRAFFSVEQPGSPSYRKFLTRTQVAARYGASSTTRTAVVRAATRHGLRAQIDPSGVFARVSGSVAQLDRVFHVHIRRVFGNEPNVVTWSLKGQGRLRLPADMRGLVEDVVPTYAHSATASGKLDRLARTARARKPRRSGRWTSGCRAAKATGAFSFAQVRHAYGIDRLGPGSGASVAVLNVGEGAPPADIAANARCFGYPRLRTLTLRSDGQTHSFGRGTFEPQEDLSVIRGMAPGLRSMTFAQVWLSPELWFLGASQVLDAPRLVDSFSISYAECDRSVRGKGSTPTTRAGADLMDALLVRLGLAGVGSYASSGDSGSTCDGQPFAGVGWPSSSPFITAVGGTQLTLNGSNERRSDVVWNDLRFETMTAGAGAGGGGFSAASPRPPFQMGLGIPGRARVTPDVSAVASAFPGWPVVLNGHWVTDAGTSGSTPLVAAAMAVLSASEQARRRPPVGPANGLLYWLAQRDPASRWDVVSGDNQWLRKVPGHRARRGFDLASGLGVPQFGVVGRGLPAPG